LRAARRTTRWRSTTLLPSCRRAEQTCDILLSLLVRAVFWTVACGCLQPVCPVRTRMQLAGRVVDRRVNAVLVNRNPIFFVSSKQGLTFFSMLQFDPGPELECFRAQTLFESVVYGAQPFNNRDSI
jgi:hypothetical protein